MKGSDSLVINFSTLLRRLESIGMIQTIQSRLFKDLLGLNLNKTK